VQFSLILMKRGTHDLCANMQKTGTPFRYFDFKFFGEFLKILRLDLASGTAAAELSVASSIRVN